MKHFYASHLPDRKYYSRSIDWPVLKLILLKVFSWRAFAWCFAHYILLLNCNKIVYKTCFANLPVQTSTIYKSQKGM